MYKINEYNKLKNEQMSYISENMKMEFKTTYRGRTNKDDWECYHYEVQLRNYITGNTHTLDYYMGLGHTVKHLGQPEQTSVPPLPFCVLNSIYLEDTRGEGFEDWCNEYGYNTDSRKALATYLQCQEQTRKFKQAFPTVSLDDHEAIINY